MKAAYIEQTGPPENIKVGDLPKPEPGPGQVLVRVHAVALNPIDLYIRSGMVAFPLAFPYVIGCDLAGTVEAVGPGLQEVEGRRSRLGIEPGTAGPAGRRRRLRGGRRAVALSHPRAPARRPGRGHGPGRNHGAPGAVPVRPAQERARRSTSPAAAAASARSSSRWPRRPGPGWPPRPAAPNGVELCRSLGADLALNYKTDDIPARLREFAPEGVDVWYETQREPNLEVSIPLLRKHGRMILMAGRTAKPTLPLGAFYPQELRAARLRHVQRHARGAGGLRPRHHPLGRGGPAQAAGGPDLPAGRRRSRPRSSSRPTPLGGAGSLTGKVVITLD